MPPTDSGVSMEERLAEALGRLKQWACDHPPWTDTFIQNPCTHSQRARDVGVVVAVLKEWDERQASGTVRNPDRTMREHWG